MMSEVRDTYFFIQHHHKLRWTEGILWSACLPICLEEITNFIDHAWVHQKMFLISEVWWLDLQLERRTNNTVHWTHFSLWKISHAEPLMPPSRFSPPGQNLLAYIISSPFFIHYPTYHPNGLKIQVIGMPCTVKVFTFRPIGTVFQFDVLALSPR